MDSKFEKKDLVKNWTLFPNDLSLSEYERTTFHQTRPLFHREYYLISAGWVGDDSTQVAVVWMTRSQNLSLVTACRAPMWECEETHSERAPEGQWLDAQPHPLFAPDGDSFLLLAAVQEGDKEHFTHIKHVTLTQQRIAVLSHGRYEVRLNRSIRIYF